MRPTGIVSDIRFLNHLTDPGHPEARERLESVHAMLARPDMTGRFADIPVRPAVSEEILLIHSPDYLIRLAATAGRERQSLTRDTHTSERSYETALLAVGGTLEAVDHVMRKTVKNAFVLARPPGHHAERSRAMGYCLMNNTAVGALYARRVLGLSRILIVDWDVHHGNGTQHAFEDDPTVLFFSIHQYPLFPNTGLFTEAGRGKGEGFTVNIPVPKGYGDAEYAALFDRILTPLAFAFLPELILVSAGFDSHGKDPLAGMKMTADGFAGLARSVMNMADACCDGRIVLILEGGYHPESLAESVKAVLMELSGRRVTNIREMAGGADPKKVSYAEKRFLEVHRSFRKLLR